MTLSLLLHLSMVIRLPKSEGKTGSDYVAFEPGTIIDKADAESGVEQPCPDDFGGIGVTTSWTGRVEKVHPGYSAATGGVKVGDVIESDQFKIRGKVGTKVTISVTRAGVPMKFTLVREKVCIRE